MRTRISAIAVVFGVTSAACAQWTTVGTIIHYNTGRVGIGTATPSGQLHVIGSTGLGTVRAENNGPGAAVIGWSRAASGVTYGTLGQAHSTSGYGLWGWATNTSGQNVGVYGQSDSPAGFGGLFKGGQFGVYGWPTATSGSTVGVYGRVSSPSGWGGIFKGGTYGVWGEVAADVQDFGWAGWFQGRIHSTRGITIGNPMYTFEASNPGLIVSDPATGFLYTMIRPGSLDLIIPSGTSNAYIMKGSGAEGTALEVVNSSINTDSLNYAATFQAFDPDTPTIDVLNTGSPGTAATFFGNGAGGFGLRSTVVLQGDGTGTAYGVYAVNEYQLGAGVFGSSTWAEAVAESAGGVYGTAVSPSIPGVRGEGPLGVVGVSAVADGRGVVGYSLGNFETSYGVLGVAAPGRFGVFSEADLGATGTKSFLIDHPLNPSDKMLRHFCAEGPEPMLMYRGTATFDNDGRAVIELPEYFESISRNVQYQLTAVGAPMPLLHVETKVGVKDARSFVVAGGAPNEEVCWVVTAERYDEYCRQHPPEVELEKPDHLRGKFLMPELYGKPASAALNARVPVGSPAVAPSLKPRDVSRGSNLAPRPVRATRTTPATPEVHVPDPHGAR